MIRIEAHTEPPGTLALGQFLRVRLVRDNDTLETRAFLKHQGVFYLEPLSQWSREEELVIYPEAPGCYVLAVEWRSGQGNRGFAEFAFQVTGGAGAGFAPQTIRLSGGLRVWVPSGWDKTVATRSEKRTLDRLRSLVGSPRRLKERQITRLLRAVLKPGQVVYDAGANVGFHALVMAQRVAPEGRVYCLEPNPVCVHFLRANVAINQIVNLEILPIALSDHSGETRFKLQYGNSNLGLVGEAAFYPGKFGHEIAVPCHSFDELLEAFSLPAPDFLKIDVEGAEHAMILGARKSLETYRPFLLLEFHHELWALETLKTMADLEYRYFDPESRVELGSLEEIRQRFANSVFHLLALPPGESL